MKSPTSDSLHECPLCENFFSFETIELHASTCEGKATSKEETEVEKSVRSPNVDSNIVDMMEECKSCPVCRRMFPISIIQVHTNACLDAEIIESC